MSKLKHRHWSGQVEGIARELSKLAIACDIKIFEPDIAERILRNDTSVCGRSNPDAFRQIRQHLMAFFPLEESAIERLGPDDTQEILDRVRAAITHVRDAGTGGRSGDG